MNAKQILFSALILGSVVNNALSMNRGNRNEKISIDQKLHVLFVNPVSGKVSEYKNEKIREFGEEAKESFLTSILKSLELEILDLYQETLEEIKMKKEALANEISRKS